MRLLVLGGTRFLGRHFAEQALAAGHSLTLMHRGRSTAASALFPQAEHVIADRDGGLGALDGRGEWDAVIDTSGYLPRVVAQSARALRERVGRYLFVSSISVYAPLPPAGGDEEAALQPLAAPTEEIDGESYGPLKALCEAEVQAALPGRSLIARPGLLVGPLDPTDRFTWWVRRMAQGGEVLVPDAGARPVQFIDARDAAAWLLLQAERGQTGVFNLTGPAQPLSFAQWFERMRAALDPQARLLPMAEDFLLAQGVQPWSDLPLWLPAEQAGLHRADIGRARATGLQCRPLEQTLLDTLAWDRSATPGRNDGAGAAAGARAARPPAGLGVEREAALRAAWLGRAAP